MEKTAMRDNFDAELKDQKMKFMMEVPPDKDGRIIIGPETSKKLRSA